MHRLRVNHSYRPKKGRFVLAARSISEAKRVRYLLGLSSPAEREHIESEYFEDEDAYQEMLMAQNDLIDAYARSELTSEERRRFEKSFMSSSRGRDRVKFARAFAAAVSATGPVGTKYSGTLLDISKTFQSLGLLQTATIGTVIVFVAMLAWLVIDRRRMVNELQKVRAESAELSKRTEALLRSSDTERTRAAEIAAQLADLRAQPDKPRHRERGTTATQRTRHLPEVKKDRERIARKPEQPEKLANTRDASLGNAFERRKITKLPLNARNVANLLSLQPATTRDSDVAVSRANQANIALDGFSVEPLLTYPLMPWNTSRSGETTIRIPSSLSSIRFQLALETAAIHEDYRLTIKPANGPPGTSVDWIAPLTPNQTIVNTPVISTSDLPSGDDVLLLMGREPDGSFVKVAEYSFKVIKY